mgnify:CR=1 FL=1
MKAQARPYMAVVANGFVRRVGVGLAGPEWCSTPVGKKRNERERESGVGLALSRSACELGGSSGGARSRISNKGHWNVLVSVPIYVSVAGCRLPGRRVAWAFGQPPSQDDQGPPWGN